MTEDRAGNWKDHSDPCKQELEKALAGAYKCLDTALTVRINMDLPNIEADDFSQNLIDAFANCALALNRLRMERGGNRLDGTK